MKTSFSAPVTFIVSGELSYLYGRPLLMCALQERVEITEGKQKNQEKLVKEIAAEIITYCKRKKISYDENYPSYSIISVPTVFDNTFSTIAAVAAFLYYRFVKKEISKESLNEIVNKVGKKSKYELSDIRGSTTIYGGLLLYRREFEFLRYITQLQIYIPENIETNMHLISLRDSSFSMKDTSRCITENYRKQPKKVESVFLEMEKATKRMILGFIKEDIHFFAQALNYAQKQLAVFDTVNTGITSLCQEISACGGGAKIIQNNFKDDTSSLLVVLEEEKLKRLQKKLRFSYSKLEQSKQGLLSDSR